MKNLKYLNAFFVCFSVHAYDTELVHESHRDDHFVDSDVDSEDSNDENNCRNDYPDSDDGCSDDTSTGYDALRRAVETIDLGKQYID